MAKVKLILGAKEIKGKEKLNKGEKKRKEERAKRRGQETHPSPTSYPSFFHPNFRAKLGRRLSK